MVTNKSLAVEQIHDNLIASYIFEEIETLKAARIIQSKIMDDRKWKNNEKNNSITMTSTLDKRF